MLCLTEFHVTKTAIRQLLTFGSCQWFVDDSFEDAAAFGLGSGELRFEPVAQGHQFIHFGDDAMLLSEGWEWKREPAQLCCIHILQPNGGSYGDLDLVPNVDSIQGEQ